MNVISARPVSVHRVATALLAAATLAAFLCGTVRPAGAQDGAVSGHDIFGTAFDMQRSLYFWMNYTDGESYGGANQHARFGGTKYVLFDDGALLLTGEGLYTDPGNTGGSAGVVRRWLVNTIVLGDAVLGAGVHWDMTQSANDHTYHQVVGTAELLAERWAVRISGYGPVGDRSNTLAVTGRTGVIGPPFFQGNYLMIGEKREVLKEVALGGLEAELAVSLGDLCGAALHRDMDADVAELFVGYYNLQGTVGRQGHGVKGGLRGYLLPSLAASVTVSNDRLFGNSLYGGFTWFFGGSGGNLPVGIQDKLTIPMVRNHQVALTTTLTNELTGPIPMTLGGQPITIMHVNSSGAIGDGTFERPHGSLTGAKADPNRADRDIVYVHGGSTFLGEGYVASPDQRVLGEGDVNIQRMNTDQLGLIRLPQVNGLGSPRPVVQDVVGTAFTVADGSEISNFQIVAATTAVAVDNLAGNVNVNRTAVIGGGTGIQVLGGSGTLTLTGVTIADPTVGGIVVDGGSSNVQFGGPNLPLAGLFGPSTLTQSSPGGAILVQGGHTGTLTQDSGSPILADNGTGLRFDNADGTYDFGGPITLAGGDARIDVAGGSDGTFSFVQPVISSPDTGPAISIVSGTAQTTFYGLDVTTSGTTGLNVSTTGLTTVDNSIYDARIVAAGAPAVDINTTELSMSFDRITATNSPAEGIDIDKVTGTFTVDDGVGLSAGTVVDGTAVGFAGIDINDSPAGTFTFAGVNIDNTGSHGIALHNAGTVNLGYDGTNFLDRGEIDSTAFGSDAVNSQNTDLYVGQLNIGSQGPVSGDGIEIVNSDGLPHHVAIHANHIVPVAPVPPVTGRGVFIDAQAGTLQVSLADNEIVSDGPAISTRDGGAAGSLVLDMAGNSPLTTNIAGVPTMEFVGAGLDSTIVRSWDGPNQITGTAAPFGTAGGGILFDRISFDADANPGNGYQQVQFTGTLSIGQVAPQTIQRVTGDGLSFVNPTGDLSLNVLNIANFNGTGLKVDTKGLGTTFNLVNGGGTIDTLGGVGTDIDPPAGAPPLDVDLTFGNLTSVDSPRAGVIIDNVTGRFHVTGTTTVLDSADAPVVIRNADNLDLNLGTTVMPQPF